MESLNWAKEHWFDLLQTVGIVGGFLMTAHAIREDTKTKRLQSLFTLTKDHREIWSDIYRRPETARILEANVDLTKYPITAEEKMAVIFVLLHMKSAFRAIRLGLYVAPEKFKSDTSVFLSLPIPHAVWHEKRHLQDADFISFVDAMAY